MNLSENLRERPKFVTEPKRILIPATKKKLEVNISKRVCNFLWAARSRLIDVGGDSVTK